MHLTCLQIQTTLEDMTASADTFSMEVIAAIRAEMGRQGKKYYELTKPLGYSYPTVSSRLNGHTAFDLDELEKVATFLGTTTEGLIESAKLGRRITNPTPTDAEVARITPPHDTWEQPARAKSRRAS